MPNLKTDSGVPSRLVSRAWFWPVLACVIVLACILAANPFNEAGFCDDWSYGRVAMRLAQTGRLEYNGWGSPILLFQVFWAIPWIRLFGFSFQVLQASMIPVALGFALLVYATGREIGLSRPLAAFASMTAGTSPLFLPLAASFMTDVSGSFFSLLCIYAALRSARADNPPASVGWLWTLALAGLAGGANRQIVWIAPITLIPYLAWVRRRNSAFRFQAAAAYLFCGIAILAIVHFLSQPYGPMEMTHRQLVWLLQHQLGEGVGLLTRFLLVCVLMPAPVFCCFLPFVRCKSPLWMLLVLVVSSVITVAGVMAAAILAPYGNHILSGAGVGTPGDWSYWAPRALTIWPQPRALTVWQRLVLTVAVNAGIVAAGPWLIRKWPSAAALGRDQTLHIFAIFSFGYFALLLPGFLTEFAYDRYMLPIIPLVMLVVLRGFSRYMRPVPLVAWLCFAVFALYGVATTHDYFARLRARVAVAHELERDGISRTRISAGVEFDGWTQLERTGYARSAQFGDRFMDDSKKGFWFEFWDHTPSFHPDFVVLYWEPGKPAPRSVITSHFRTWLPPYEGLMVAWRRSDLTERLQAARLTAFSPARF